MITTVGVVARFPPDLSAVHTRHTAGKQGLSCHGVVESTPVLSSAYKQAAASLFQHYFPIETDAKLSIPEKIPLMTEWYEKGHDLLITEGFKRQHLADAVEVSTKGGRIKLRDGFSSIFDASKQHGIPLLIFSAGIGSTLSHTALVSWFTVCPPLTRPTAAMQMC
jgi:5'-nucleotidase